jgi:hypothetical protein
MKGETVKLLRKMTVLFVILLLVACATAGYRSTYVQAEQQWITLAQDYKAFKDAGLVSEENQVIIESLFERFSLVLDLYKVAVLSGEPTEQLVRDINDFKRELLLELARIKGGN